MPERQAGHLPQVIPGREHYFLADMHGTHFGADLGNFPGDIASRDMRQWNLIAGQSAPDPKIEMIEATGAHVNEDFIMSKMGFRNVGVVQNTGVTVLMEKNSFHERPPQKETHKCAVDRRIVARYIGGTWSERPKENATPGF